MLKRGGPNEAVAYAKVLAAHTALVICRENGIKLTTTKTGKFCRMAATLYGDPTADLQYQCRSMLKLDQRSEKLRPKYFPFFAKSEFNKEAS